MSRKEYEFEKQRTERKRRAKNKRKNRRDRVAEKHTALARAPRANGGNGETSDE